ncbi:hypothetical protein K474DRAFT_1711363 [Panus rudis PR-1116 ss-1]|nr:hypothetical protein K474DRAFT_1711363 [Panus rudis PR-1116 ss-1]
MGTTADSMDMSDSVAVFLAGVMLTLYLSFVLYGITIVQVLILASNCREDGRYLKCIVGATFLLETVQTISCIRVVYIMTVEDFGDVVNLDKITLPCALCLLSENMLVAIVQSFYIRRIWILGERTNWCLLVCTLILLVLRVSLNLVGTVNLQSATWTELHSRRITSILINGGVASSVLLDAVIAIAMIYYLRQQMTGFTNSDDVIRWVLVYAVNTGAITFSLAAAVMILYAAMPQSLVFAGLLILMSRLYANSLLGS